MNTKRAQIRELLIKARFILESDSDTTKSALGSVINGYASLVGVDTTIPRKVEDAGKGSTVLAFPAAVSAKVPRREKDKVVTSTRREAMRLLAGYFSRFDHSFCYHHYSPPKDRKIETFEIIIRDLDSSQDWRIATCHQGNSDVSWINAAADLIEKSGKAKKAKHHSGHCTVDPAGSE